jgi:DNA processing protein
LNELGPLPVPARLFVQGRSLEPGKPAVAIVGTRRPTAAGVEAARVFARAFAEAGLVVVSGLAVGIDAAAHEAALSSGGHTVAVLGCGLDVDYPRRNRSLRQAIAEKGTLVSEFPDGTPPRRAHFPERNRIIVGLVRGVLVVEGGERSGAMITARYALDANRDVWAVPGSLRNPNSYAPNHLIRTGQAALVTEPAHVFDELAPGMVWGQASLPEAATVDPVDLPVLHCLDDVPVMAGHVARITGRPVGQIGLSLARLEVKGLARRRGAGYEITEKGARTRFALTGTED